MILIKKYFSRKSKQRRIFCTVVFMQYTNVLSLSKLCVRLRTVSLSVTARGEELVLSSEIKKKTTIKLKTMNVYYIKTIVQFSDSENLHTLFWPQPYMYARNNFDGKAILYRITYTYLFSVSGNRTHDFQQNAKQQIHYTTELVYLALRFFNIFTFFVLFAQ